MRLGFTLMIGTIAAAVSLAPAGSADAAPRGKNRLVPYTPDQYERLETVVTKSKERKYYVMSTAKPLEFSVTGPTTLDISTRLLFTVEMKGEQRYTIAVTEGALLDSARDVLAKTLTTRKSPVSSLASGGALVPGTGRRLTLNVPAGPHQYRLQLSGTAAHEVAVRILIPKKDIHP